jgi:UDP-N-acetylmuramyl pentapeptide synthase
MSNPFELTWNQAENRLEFVMRGKWTAQDLQKWTTTYSATVRQGRPGWTLLGDMSEYPPQSEEVSAGHEKMMALTMAAGASRVALVVPKAVVAMQMKRLQGNAGVNMKHVSSRDEALAYLTAA